jgi:uncharacterized repeat protein (TIGR01451 family)
MGPKGKRVCLALFLAMGVGLLPGCFGITSNPSYFPNLCPPGDIIPTHAKPPGWSYFANFDPYAVSMEVRPQDATNPVRTQHVLIATVLDKDGHPLRGRRVEWILEGTAGNIVEVDESGCWPGRGYKDGLKHAVSYTDYFEHTITRGNKNPNDDFTIRPGQTWCVITSAVEGDTHITCYAPGIFDWERGRVFVSCKWVDGNWQFPPSALVPAGTEHVLSTKVYRHTDKQPLANYRVHYTILDEDPQVVFKHTRTREATVSSDLAGSANATLVQIAAKPGLTHIGVEIIRPPDPTSPSGVGIVLAHGETAIEWLAPAIVLNHTGPALAGRDAQVTYTTTIVNGGKVESRSMFVTQPMPDGLQYVSSQPQAIVDGKQLVWTLGQLLPGQTHTLQTTYKIVRTGSFTCCATVNTEEGLRDTKCVKTDVGEPRLRVTMDGPKTGQVGVPFSYKITVVNEGAIPLNKVMVDASFDSALRHASKTTKMQAELGTLNPGQPFPLPALTLTPAEVGAHTTRVQVKAEGGLTDQTEQTIVVSQPQLGVKLIGPDKINANWPVVWKIRVSNDGDAPLTEVQVRNLLPADVKAQDWTDGGQPGNSEVVWNVGNLAPREAKTLSVKILGDKLKTNVVNRVVATAAGGLSATDQATFDIYGQPGLHMEVRPPSEQPVLTGKTVKYYINVINTGAGPAKDIEIKATLPPELKPAVEGTKGPTVPHLNGQVVTFDRVDSLPGQQKAEFQVEALAQKAGDVRFHVEMRSSSLADPQPVVSEQQTQIVEAPP